MDRDGNTDGMGPDRVRVAVWIFSGVFVSVVLALVIFYMVLPKDSDIKEDPFANLSGRVYLTLALKDDRAADLYYFDLEKRQLDKFIEDEYTKYTNRFSPSGDKVAYTAAVLDLEAPLRPERKGRDTFPFRGTLELYVRDVSTGETKKLTDDDVKKEHLDGKRLPRWSPDEKHIAFSAQRLDAFQYDLISILDPNSWDVFISDLDGNVEHAYSGSYSFWSPDGNKLLYLQGDGLYLYNIGDKSSEKVEHIGGLGASTGMKLDVSRDGTLLAWGRSGARPNRNLRLFKIFSWEPFLMEEIWKLDTSNTLAMWPVFSPDNRYLVTEEAEFNENTETVSNLRLMIYDLETHDSMELMSLEDYNFDVSYITDWR